jgi:hypothetical protein
VSGIYQEIWGLLTAYNLIRMEMSQIAREAKVSPLRISFVMAMRLIQDELIWWTVRISKNQYPVHSKHLK